MTVRTHHIAFRGLTDEHLNGPPVVNELGDRVQLHAPRVVPVHATGPSFPPTIGTTKRHFELVVEVLQLESAKPRRRQLRLRTPLRRALIPRIASVASCASRNALGQLGANSECRHTQLNHPREIAVLLIGMNVVRIDGTDVAVAAVNTATAFPPVDNRLQPSSRPSEIRRPDSKPPLTIPFARKFAVFGAGPPPLVPRLILRLLLWQLSFFSLCLSADSGQPTKASSLSVEG